MADSRAKVQAAVDQAWETMRDCREVLLAVEQGEVVPVPGSTLLKGMAALIRLELELRATE